MYACNLPKVGRSIKWRAKVLYKESRILLIEIKNSFKYMIACLGLVFFNLLVNWPCKISGKGHYHGALLSIRIPGCPSIWIMASPRHARVLSVLVWALSIRPSPLNNTAQAIEVRFYKIVFYFYRKVYNMDFFEICNKNLIHLTVCIFALS